MLDHSQEGNTTRGSVPHTSYTESQLRQRLDRAARNKLHAPREYDSVNSNIPLECACERAALRIY